MADLSTLMQYAPTTGAGFIGINQRNNEILDQLKQQELAQLMQNRMGEEQRKAAMHPFELDKMRLGNDQMSAQLPGMRANSELAQTKARVAAGTAQSDIDQGITENATKSYKAIGGSLGSIASELEKVNDVEKPRAFAEALRRMGLPESAQQQFIQRYSRYSPGELAKRLKEDSERILRENESYVRTMDQQRLQEQGADRRNASTNANQVKLEEMRINAGKYDRNRSASNLAQALMKVRSAAQAAELYEIAAYEAKANGDEDAANQYATRAQQARQRAAEDASNRGMARPDVDPNQFGIGTTPRPTANAPIAGGGAAPPPQTRKPQTLADLQKLYPGVPADKLREAYKKKFGVDLK